MRKWWGIRHLRYYKYCIEYWWFWVTCGRYLGLFMNPADEQYLQDVWDGKE